MAKKVESELIPKIKERGEELSNENLEEKTPEDLQKSLIIRYEELKNWQEIYRSNVGQLADGGCLELATAYKRIAKHLPRDNH